MRNKENLLLEALRICKQTNFNPWEDPSLKRGTISEVDYQSKKAEVQINNDIITVPIEESIFELICDIGHIYGATAFIKQNVMVNFSYQTLTPVRQESEEVIVYE